MTYLLIVITIIFLLIILYFLLVYNKLVKLNNNVKEAFSTMDVYLKKRWDLIPNLIETVKGYTKHEKETLKEIVELRNGIKSYDKLSNDEKIKTNQDLAKGLNKLMVIAESYPELKSNDNYINLQNNLSNIEDEIAQSRKYYNAVIREFNNKVEMIPSNIIAKLLGYKSKKMYEIDDEKRENIKVNL